MRPTLQVLGILAVCGLVFNMVAIPLYQEDLFFNQDTLLPIGIIILAGILLFFIFNILAVVWISFRLLRQKESQSQDSLALLWGILCVIILMVEKVMIDEIARETRFGMETLGEWIILYMSFMVQLLYSIFMVFQVIRTNRVPQVEIH